MIDYPTVIDKTFSDYVDVADVSDNFLFNNVPEDYEYDDADKLLNVKINNNPVKEYSYDACGRLIEVESLAGITSLSWGYEDRLIGIAYPNSSSNSFGYNPLGATANKMEEKLEDDGLNEKEVEAFRLFLYKYFELSNSPDPDNPMKSSVYSPRLSLITKRRAIWVDLLDGIAKAVNEAGITYYFNFPNSNTVASIVVEDGLGFKNISPPVLAPGWGWHKANPKAGGAPSSRFPCY